VTKEVKELLGENETESVLQRLDQRTRGESKMAVAQTLDVNCSLVNNMEVVMEGGYRLLMWLGSWYEIRICRR
jgi:hypothetical protein